MNLKNDKNQYMLPIVNRSAQNCSDILIKFSEDMYSARLTETILSSFGKRIILISGPSASGKTTTAKKLADSLLSIGRAASVISMDDFYKHRFEMPVIDGKINAEIIEALEMDLLKKVMKEFLKTGKASLPRYDFTDGIRRDNFYEIDSGKDGILILEGLHAINPLVFSGLYEDSYYRIYVSPHSGFVGENSILERKELRFLRRLVRDFYTRSSSAERTFEMWSDVCSCEDVYVRPLGKTADRILDTTHPYEICVLKETAIEILKTIKEDSEYYKEALRLIDFLEEVYSLPLEFIPETSLLNEFLPSHMFK